MDHSQAKRYAIQMILKRIERDAIDIANPNFMPELNGEDREKVEGCLRDIFQSLSPLGLEDNDYDEIGFVAQWLKKE